MNLNLDPMTPAQTVAAISKAVNDAAHQISASVGRGANATTSADCDVAIATVVIDAVMVVIQAIGLPGAIAQRSSARLVTEATPLIRASMRTYQILVNNIRLAATAMEKAKAYYQVFVTFTRTFGIKAIFKEIRHSMHWYDWLLMGLIILGQLILLIATDGAAVILEISLLVLSVTALGVAIMNAVNACSLSNHPGRSLPELVNKGLLLLPGEMLRANEVLESANGKYQVTVTPDGNLVLSSGGNVLWQSNTSGHPGSVLEMSESGFLTMKSDDSGDGAITWGAGVGATIGNYLMLSNSGQMMVMNANDNTTKWTS